MAKYVPSNVLVQKAYRWLGVGYILWVSALIAFLFGDLQAAGFAFGCIIASVIPTAILHHYVYEIKETLLVEQQMAKAEEALREERIKPFRFR